MPSLLVCEGRTHNTRGYPPLLPDVWVSRFPLAAYVSDGGMQEASGDITRQWWAGMRLPHRVVGWMIGHLAAVGDVQAH